MNMPDSINGNTYTYMFWLKIDSFQYTQVHKVLWYRSSDPHNAVATPLVLLDNDSNRMYVLLATNRTNAALSLDAIVTAPLEKLKSEYRFAVSVIDYVPMNRWVHIGIIAKDRMISLVLDGELHSNGTVDTYAASSTESGRPVILPASGIVYVGGTGNVLSATLSRLEFCNYDMIASDVRKTYEQGVTGSMLTSAGLPMYALRNPIYRIY
jgi:hypothetical protein